MRVQQSLPVAAACGSIAAEAGSAFGLLTLAGLHLRRLTPKTASHRRGKVCNPYVPDPPSCGCQLDECGVFGGVGVRNLHVPMLNPASGPISLETPPRAVGALSGAFYFTHIEKRLPSMDASAAVR